MLSSDAYPLVSEYGTFVKVEVERRLAGYSRCHRRLPVAKGQAFDRMALMRSDPSITRLAIGKAMGISDRAVRKRITKMREAGFLLRTGGRKGGHWEVLK